MGQKRLLTPTYQIHKMYIPFQNATLVPISLDSGTFNTGDIALPRLDAIAAKGKDGRLWLAITNVDPANPAEVSLSGFKSAWGEVLTAAKVDTVNTFAKPEIVKPSPFKASAVVGKLTLRLPSKSVTVVPLN